MAVDSRNKRFGMLNFRSGVRKFFQNPVGTIGAVGRAMLLDWYPGVSAAPPPVNQPRTLTALISSNTRRTVHASHRVYISARASK